MPTNSNDGIPSFFHMLWPCVLAVRELGGSGSIEEIDRAAIQIMGFSEEQQQIVMKNGRYLKINYRLAWAKTHLKGAGLLVNSTRGVWSLTPDGFTVTEDEVSERVKAYRARFGSQNSPPTDSTDDEQEDDDAELLSGDGETDWKDRLLDAIANLSASGFERLCQRLLREAGFRDVDVIGRTGDNGIDVVGSYRVSLISFQTYVQCKRYAVTSPVGSGEMRNFRGAMRGIGDKGLFITTARFTASAKEEATRDGVEAIELIDGDRLCDLMKDFRLGLDVEMVEKVSLVPSFFEAFQE